MREKELIASGDGTVRSQATVKGVAEICMMAIMPGGTMTYVVSGHNALKAAKEQARELAKE